MRLGIVAFACALLLGAGAADADDRHRGGWRDGRHGWNHRHYDRGDSWRHHRHHYRHDRRYYGRDWRRPVVVPPPYYYAPAPPAYYYPPRAGLSLFVPLR